MHKYGDEHPESGLKTKLKGFQFSQNLEIQDPIKRTITKEPMKPFMVNQLAIAFERDNMLLSPFDDTLHKQLVDYEVEKIAANGKPVFTDKNEHFVDALGLAYLAFVLEFPDITKTVFEVEKSSPLDYIRSNPLQDRIEQAINGVINNPLAGNPWKNSLRNGSFTPESAADPCERDVPKYFKYDMPVSRGRTVRRSGGSWAPRSASPFGGGFGRSMW